MTGVLCSIAGSYPGFSTLFFHWVSVGSCLGGGRGEGEIDIWYWEFGNGEGRLSERF